MAERRRGDLQAAHVGYYRSTRATEPDYDPPHDSPCPICGRPVTTDDVRTVSLMSERRRFSVFYRLHRTCGNDSAPAALVACDENALRLMGELPVL